MRESCEFRAKKGSHLERERSMLALRFRAICVRGAHAGGALLGTKNRHGEDGRMRSWISLRNWFAVVLTGCALVADVAGCGGANPRRLPPRHGPGGAVALGGALGRGCADT